MKCYVAAHDEDGRIRYYFRRMADGVDKIKDTISFVRDEDVFNMLTEEQRDELTSVLLHCNYMWEHGTWINESRKRSWPKYRSICNGYYVEFDLITETQIEM